MSATLDFKSFKSLKSWRTLSERERRVLLIGGGIAVVLFIFVVALPLDRSVARLNHTVARKQTDLAWMRSVAPRLAAAGPAASASTNEPLIVLVNESARQTGLALSGTGPSGNGGLNVQMRGVPFDSLIGWLARLQQQYGVQVQSASISRSGAPGLVDASFVLGKP